MHFRNLISHSLTLLTHSQSRNLISHSLTLYLMSQPHLAATHSSSQQYAFKFDAETHMKACANMPQLESPVKVGAETRSLLR